LIVSNWALTQRLRPERGDGVKRAQRAAERERVGVGPHAQ
jgi:hypothetical protein